VLHVVVRAVPRCASDLFAREKIHFVERVRNRYLAAAAAEPQRMRVIDAGHDIPAVQAQLRSVLEVFLR